MAKEKDQAAKLEALVLETNNDMKKMSKTYTELIVERAQEVDPSMDFLSTSKKIVSQKWIQSGKEGNYTNLYQQTYDRKVLKRESEIRRISWYKEREQDYEGEDSGCYKEQCFSGNPKKFNMLVQLIQAGTISSRHERGKSIYGSETLQNGRNPYLTRSHSEEQHRTMF
jgi:hypothetical protein